MKKFDVNSESQYVDKVVSRRLNEQIIKLDPIIEFRTRYGNFHWFYYEKLYSVLRQGPKCKVLDVACGIGFLSVLLAKYGHQVVAIDISKNSIEYARKLAAENNCLDKIEFRVEDICKLDLESDQFDIITGEDALHHVIKYPGSVENIYRVLKPGGKIYFSEPFAFNPLINAMRFINVRIKNHQGEQFLGRNELQTLNACFKDIKITDRSVFYVFSRFFQKPTNLNRRINIALKTIDDFLQRKIPYLSKFYALAFLEMTK